MEKKRIGKTLKIRWAILTGGEPEPLAGRDLTLEISSGNRVRTTLSFVADGNVAAFVFEGSEQRYVGPYTVTMWENLGKEGQTVVDRCDAFCLVARSCEEAESGSAEDPGLEIESLDLGTSNFEAGVPGSSAYELFKKYNPDSELTEEEYAESPIQAAGVALAMVEQLEKTETLVKQAEQLRKQAEQGREASEQARATAEQARVTAEQQRALAEQTRVTNESARQTAEAGRQAAETKREENTAEAIRNSEEATRKAEDEAARVRILADNPPKIVEVDGAKYWATWNEALGQYVVSENRADVGDAVLFSPQVLTPQQQEQARKNIGISLQNDISKIIYKCQRSEDFAIPIPNSEDLLVLEFKYGTFLQRKTKDGSLVWKMGAMLYLSKVKGRIDNSIIIDGDYIYARSSPHGVFKINISTGEYINNQDALNYVLAICLFNDKIYAFGANSSVILKKDDLSLIKQIEVKASEVFSIIAYEDRILVPNATPSYVIHLDDSVDTIDGSYSFLAYISRSTYENRPYYVAISDKNLQTFSEDGEKTFTSTDNRISTVLGLAIDIVLVSARGGWRGLLVLTTKGYLYYNFPGNSAPKYICSGLYNPYPITLFQEYPVGITEDGSYILRKGNYIVKQKFIM